MELFEQPESSKEHVLLSLNRARSALFLYFRKQNQGEQHEMGFNCGIIGLPNVGKSTIFNAMTAAGVESSNYPFCTIDPNVGMVPLRDLRLYRLASLVKPERVLPTSVEFVDIAGLVKGARKGGGVGLQVFWKHPG